MVERGRKNRRGREGGRAENITDPEFDSRLRNTVIRSSFALIMCKKINKERIFRILKT